MASSGPQSYIDRLRSIEASACTGRDVTSGPVALDPCITQLVQLAEELLAERELLLTKGEELAGSVFRRAATEYRAQVKEQAAAYSRAYTEIDSALATWRAWTHGHVTAAPAPAPAPAWRPSVFS